MLKIDVSKWPLEQFKNSRDNGTLNVSPEYQRRSVWKEHDKILLIDSIVRRLPIGAITMFKETSPEGLSVYEVIDGKQRMTAFFDYLNGEFPLRSTVIRKNIEEDEDEVPIDGAPSTFYDRHWSELTPSEKTKLLQYEVPVFLVEGTREDAVFAFYRMNKTNYALKPQEIRNAIFTDTPFLKTVTSLEERLSTDLTGGQHFLGAIGAVSRQGLERMQDIQLLSELLILVLHGPQHRRDTIDKMYAAYKTGGVDDLKKKSEYLYKLLEQWHEIFDSQPLQSWHFPTNCENDLYALVGALDQHGILSSKQVTEFRQEIAINVSEFRRSVEMFIKTTRERAIDPDEFPSNVEEYGRTFLGGQINGKDKRETRIRLLRELLDELVSPLDTKRSFSPAQRWTIWCRSSEKTCARCGEQVEWKDFHAGHKVSHARGGRTVVENGQIEHSWCNQQAGASD